MILVFGSLNADFFLNVKDFPAPGETVLTPCAVVKPGGKGANQAAAAAKVGGIVKMVGCVGNDDVSKIPVTALKALGIDCSHMQVGKNATGMAMIMVDQNAENSIVVASGANTELSADNVPESMLFPETVVVMQMEVPAVENFKLLERAKAKGARTVLNVAPATEVPDYVLKNIDYLILNEIEAEAVSGVKGQKPQETALLLSEKTGGVVLITLGKQGVVAAQGDKIVRAGCLSIRPVDTTGAGDAFVGIFSAMIDAGMTLENAMKYASAGAGLACLKTGAQEALPQLKEIELHIQEIEMA